MDRRSFLRFLGIATALPIAAKLGDAIQEPVSAGQVPTGQVLTVTGSSNVGWKTAPAKPMTLPGSTYPKSGHFVIYIDGVRTEQPVFFS